MRLKTAISQQCWSLYTDPVIISYIVVSNQLKPVIQTCLTCFMLLVLNFMSCVIKTSVNEAVDSSKIIVIMVLI